MPSVIVLLLVLLASGAAPAGAGEIEQSGPGVDRPVGYRLLSIRDASRSLIVASQDGGRSTSRRVDWPLQISIWYPAAVSTQPRMRDGDYRTLAYTGDTLEAVTAAHRSRAANDLRAEVQAHAARTLTQDAAAAHLASETQAQRDAPPAAGRFPVVIGGLGGPHTAWPLAEALARRGYVVVTAPSLARTATAEAVQPAVALEMQSRTMEALIAAASRLPFVDVDRLALAGVNFNGMAVLNVQARQMRARALVSLDGWEGKAHGGGILATSPSFNPARVQVPYLTVQWDEPNLPPLDFSVFDSLAYADRRTVVIPGLGHHDLSGSGSTMPDLPAAKRAGLACLHATVAAFLDRHVVEQQAGEPAGCATAPLVDRQARGLPAVPTAEELEFVLWEQRDVERGVRLIEAARAANSRARVIDARTLQVFAFRYQQQGRTEEAARLRALAAQLATP